jgi:hypothetical protein
LDRVAEFKAWLKGRKENTILVIGHGDFLAILSGEQVRLDNAQMFELHL